MVGSKTRVGRTEFAYGLLVICRLFFSWRYKIHYGRLWLRRIENVAVPRRLGWSWYSQLQIYNSWIVCLPVGRQYNYGSNTTDLEQRFLNFLDCGNQTSLSLGGPSFLSHRYSITRNLMQSMMPNMTKDVSDTN